MLPTHPQRIYNIFPTPSLNLKPQNPKFLTDMIQGIWFSSFVFELFYYGALERFCESKILVKNYSTHAGFCELPSSR